MKKVALSLLALTLMAAGAFAEDAAAPAPALKFSGYFNSGFNADFKDGTGTYVGYAHDWDDGSAGAFRLVGLYDATSWGYKFRLQDTYSVAGTYTPAVNYAYGWVKPVAGLTLIGGKHSDSTLASIDWTGNKVLAGEGAEVLYSISGATFGASIIVPGTADDTVTGAFGAKYVLDKVFAAVLTTKLANQSVDRLEASAELDAVPGLSLNAGYVASGLATTKTDFIDVNGSYAITDAFSASVLGFFYLDPTAYVSITPALGYVVVPNLTLGGEVKFVTGTDATQVPAVTAVYAVGGATFKGYAGYDITLKTTKTYLDFLFSF